MCFAALRLSITRAFRRGVLKLIVAILLLEKMLEKMQKTSLSGSEREGKKTYMNPKSFLNLFSTENCHKKCYKRTSRSHILTRQDCSRCSVVCNLRKNGT